MQCPRCHERVEDGGHWCVPYASWVAQGMFDFVRTTIGARDAYRRSGKAPEAAVTGFSSCLVMSVTMVQAGPDEAGRPCDQHMSHVLASPSLRLRL